MASSRKSFVSKATSNYMIFPSSSSDHNDDMLEFDEAELYNYNFEAKSKKKGMKRSSCGPARKNKNKAIVDTAQQQQASSSLPMNIPDWSKILKDEYKDHTKWEGDDGEEEEDHDNNNNNNNNNDNGGIIRVPPHEYLARTRGASLSVHEGIGRTLKGRDLRSVRNAIWKKVGFED